MSTVQEYCIQHGNQDFVVTGEGLCCPVCQPELAAREKEFFIIKISVCFDTASKEENSFGLVRKAVDDSFEVQFAREMLRRHNGNVSAAAKEARMDRKHLRDLCKKHGVDLPWTGK